MEPSDNSSIPNHQPAPGAPVESFDPSSNVLTAAQELEMENYAISRNLLTREQIHAMKAQRSGAAAQHAPPDGGDTISDEDLAVINRDNPIARAERIPLPNYLQPGEQFDPAVDMQYRNWIVEAGLSETQGGAFAETAFNSAKQLSSMAPADRQLYGAQQRAMLLELWGSRFEQKVAAAKSVVAQVEAKRPGLRAWLEETGVGDCALLIKMLADHGELLAARARKR